MSERRRLLMAQGEEDNPWEKLDYLTIVPLEAKIMAITIVPTFAEIEEYDEENDEYYYYYNSCYMQYSKDGGNNWTTIYFQEDDHPVMSISIDGRKGETLKLRGNLLSFLSNLDDYGYEVHTRTQIGVSAAKYGNIAVAGSPLSLLSSNLVNAFSYVNSILPSNIFEGLFANCGWLTEILNPKTFLPSTRVGIGSYMTMFYRCISLVNAPELPATSINDYCYIQMFEQCSSLINPPDLPSLELGYTCYNRMFYGCTSLIRAPKLPAKQLTQSCYEMMFYGCSSLVEAPEISAESLAPRCCIDMFRNCTSLKYIKAMFIGPPYPSIGYTTNWVSGVSPTGTFVKNKYATWNVTGAHGIPSNWTVITE